METYHKNANRWDTFAHIVKINRVKIRLILNDGEVTEWSKWLTFPATNYCDSEAGPYSFSVISEVELQTIEVKHIGVRVPPKKIDHSIEIENTLTDAKIHYQKIAELIRISL